MSCSLNCWQSLGGFFALRGRCRLHSPNCPHAQCHSVCLLYVQVSEVKVDNLVPIKWGACLITISLPWVVVRWCWVKDQCLPFCSEVNCVTEGHGVGCPYKSFSVDLIDATQRGVVKCPFLSDILLCAQKPSLSILVRFTVWPCLFISFVLLVFLGLL